MKKLFFAMSALAALSLLAPSSGVAQDINQIGIYSTSTPVPNSAEARMDPILPGQFICYVVLTNPYNNVSTMAPIVQVGGFEFHLNMPAEFLIVTTSMPAGTFNFATPPTFYVSGLLDVVAGQCLLATLTVATFTGSSGLIYMEPVPGAPSIPGSLAITDGGDNYRLLEAFPASGDLANPIFGIAMDVVPSEEASWSDLKALYR